MQTSLGRWVNSVVLFLKDLGDVLVVWKKGPWHIHSLDSQPMLAIVYHQEKVIAIAIAKNNIQLLSSKIEEDYRLYGIQ